MAVECDIWHSFKHFSHARCVLFADVWHSFQTIRFQIAENKSRCGSVFGDSYTDDGPNYYTPEPDQNLASYRDRSMNGHSILKLMIATQSTVTTTGGRIWTEYIQQYTGINLYDYAVSGAVCDIYFSPSTRSGVKQNQVPYFLQDNKYVGSGSITNPANGTI